jgi:endonuclease/exonuclease/phosphatase family metal-dependent hydrolase
VALPAHSAAWLAALLCCAAAACDQQRGTKDWNTPGKTPPPPARQASPPSQPSEPEPARNRDRSAERAPQSAVPEASAATTGLRFITYNVENWLVMDREVEQDGKRVKLPSSPKPDKEKQAAATILARHQPDVLGVCEIGGPKDLAEIQSLLKTRGLDLPHRHFASGSDQERHLGLLSRFPITATGTPVKLDYQINGNAFTMTRGVLDATLTARDKSYRFLGVHLKSQREVEEGDQAKMRLHEAHLLRDHVDAILAADPKARLIVYGDFNDNWGTPPIKTIVGTYNTPSYLTAIRAKDRAGVYWTHYWAIRDSYSRLDYIAVSQALRRDTDFATCRIIDDPEWLDASDHRPVMAVFR